MLKRYDTRAPPCISFRCLSFCICWHWTSAFTLHCWLCTHPQTTHRCTLQHTSSLAVIGSSCSSRCSIKTEWKIQNNKSTWDFPRYFFFPPWGSQDAAVIHAKVASKPPTYCFHCVPAQCSTHCSLALEACVLDLRSLYTIPGFHFKGFHAQP